MIVCCYTETDHKWSDDVLQHKLALLAPEMKEQALRKRQWLDRQLTIEGKLMLMKVLKRFELDKALSLNQIRYSNHHRPYFNTGFDFNIAHSGNIAICCGTLDGKIGIDIEQIKKTDLAYYKDYFTPNEWQLINGAANKYDGFYRFWSRKEAVLKAIGTGFHTPLSSIDVTADVVAHEDTLYYLQTPVIKNGYKCCIARTVKDEQVNIVKSM